MNNSDLELITRVAWLHFMEGMTQREIARHLNISQPKVARLLDRAQKNGIVKISIESPLANCLTIEKKTKRFLPSLEDIVVFPPPPPTSDRH